MNYKREKIELADTLTGEVNTYVKLNPEDRIVTTNQDEWYSEFKSRFTKKNFIFAIFERCEIYMKKKELTPQEISRIIMLSTYLNYDGRLMLTERTLMTKKEMKNIIRESNASRFNAFYKKLIDLKILIEAEKSLYLNSNYYKKGTLPSKTRASRIFIKEVRTLFNGVKARDIKRLGYVFMLLPYFSIDYNIACKNPEEKCLDLVQSLTTEEIGEILGVDRTSVIKALKTMSEITIDDRVLIGWFTFGNNNVKLMVNPRILYAGTANEENGAIRLIDKLFEA